MTDVTIVADMTGAPADGTRILSSREAILEAVRPLAILEVIQGDKMGERFEVHPGRTKLGKAPREEGGIALLPLGDPFMSRDHAAVIAGPGGLVLLDLGSTNGTWVNGRRVERAVLAENDQVVLGRTTLRVSFHALPRPDASLDPRS